MKKVLLLVLLVGAGLAGIAVWAFYPRTYTLSEQKVQFTHLQYGTLRESVSATGRLELRETLAVSCELPGTVIALKARINDVVEEGDVLAVLDREKAQRDVDEADVGVRAAKAQVAQAEALKNAALLEVKFQADVQQGGFRSEKEQADVKLQSAQAGVLAAQVKLEASRIDLAKAKDAFQRTEIKVPIRCCPQTQSRGAFDVAAPGKGLRESRKYIVIDRQVQAGQFVVPQGPPLFLLTPDLEYMEMHANVAEGDIGRIRPGMPVRFTVQAFTDEDVPFAGNVTEIRPLGVNSKGAVYFSTIIAVEKNKKDPVSGEWRLRPGMTTSVDIVRREHKDAWKIPTEALNFQLDRAYQSEAARRRVAQWQERRDAADWQTVWTWSSDHGGPWPMFLRLSGLRSDGKPGIKDADFVEVLEVEPGVDLRPQSPPRIIIEAPPARSSGFFDQPMNIKVS